jgi:hypothetical protein
MCSYLALMAHEYYDIFVPGVDDIKQEEGDLA